MPVYLIRAGEHGPVKIGHAIAPEERLSELQVAHWETLRLLRLWRGGIAEEASLHVRFSDLRIRGEWFSFSRHMLGDVGLVPIELPVEGGKGKWAREQFLVCSLPAMQISEIIAAGGGPSRLGKAVGLKHSSVLSWTSVPPKHVAAVSSATGIPKHVIRPDIWPSPPPGEVA